MISVAVELAPAAGWAYLPGEAGMSTMEGRELLGLRTRDDVRGSTAGGSGVVDVIIVGNWRATRLLLLTDFLKRSTASISFFW